MKRRGMLKAAVTAGVAGVFSPRIAASQGGMLRIVVPYAAGGQSDVMMRVLGPSLEKTLGRQVLIDNRPGGAALIGTKLVEAAKPDGNTLLYHNSGFVALPMLLKAADYDPLKSFDAVCMIGVSPSLLAS